MAHIAALRAFPDGPPVGVTVFVEGEEEIGSDSLLTILERHSEKLRADAIVLADSGNWDIGEPALTVTLRGLIRVVVTITTLDHGVHSGMFGGAVPDAITTLIRLIATLHDADGNLTVEGLKSGEASDLDYDEKRLRLESGLLDGVQIIGSGSILTRLWNKPALTTIGFNAPSVEKSSNTLVPSASAKLSMRIAPDEDTQDAYALLRDHLEKHLPWGARMEIHPRRRRPRVRRRRGRSRSTTRPAPRSPTPGASSRSTSGPAGRSRSWRGSPRSSPRPRSS